MGSVKCFGGIQRWKSHSNRHQAPEGNAGDGNCIPRSSESEQKGKCSRCVCVSAHMCVCVHMYMCVHLHVHVCVCFQDNIELLLDYVWYVK